MLITCAHLSFYGKAQTETKDPEHELALALKVVSGKIIYGANEFYVTEPHSIYLQPGVRYGYPVKLSRYGTVPHYISIVGQAGFLFCKAKKIDSLYFNSKNPTYLPVSVGIYNLSSFSVGGELFFWKGLGNRDIWGVKFLSVGYNGTNFRLNASGEYYTQLTDAKKNGLVFSVEFFWKLIKG